jgi:SAM-dependent methyltransferase
MPLLDKLPIFKWHERNVVGTRRARLAGAICDLAPSSAVSMLDVGCGDGSMTKIIADRIGAKDVHGVDIKIRPNSVIDVREYDGRHLPFGDAQFDLVTIVDVLHHCEDLRAVFGEIMRVVKPRGVVVIKDHFQFGPWSDYVLWAMDVFGNYAPGITVRGHYLSPPEWVDLVASAGGKVDKLLWPFRVHDLPWTLVARSEYQFLMRVLRA